MSAETIAADQIQSRIFALRGQRVLLDQDLAAFYGVPAGALNQAVKRNRNRFPSDFFQLNNEELTHLKSQFVISSNGHGGRRSLPSAYTEHGSLMAATVLNSARAVQMSLIVIRVFVALRRMLLDQKALAEKVEELDARVGGHDEQLIQIIEAIRQIIAPSESEHHRKIGFHPGNR